MMLQPLHCFLKPSFCPLSLHLDSGEVKEPKPHVQLNPISFLGHSLGPGSQSDIFSNCQPQKPLPGYKELQVKLINFVQTHAGAVLIG